MAKTQHIHEKLAKTIIMFKFSLSLRTKALFSSPQKSKTFQDFPSHRILRHMHEAQNIDENKN